MRAHAAFREQLETAGVVVHERVGPARFVDSHTIETAAGLRIRAERIVLCTGGVSRRLAVPGAELTATHSDAWSLTSVPPSMIVVGAGATGVQVASIFRAFGTRVALFQAGERILPTEDADVSAAVATAFRAAGMTVREGFGAIERFERVPDGVRMVFAKDGTRESAETALVVLAVGWTADTGALRLDRAGVETDGRGFVRVDQLLHTTAPHVYAAGDVTGRLMLVPQAIQDGFVAGTNAVQGPTTRLQDTVAPVGSFAAVAVAGVPPVHGVADVEVVEADDADARVLLGERRAGGGIEVGRGPLDPRGRLAGGQDEAEDGAYPRFLPLSRRVAVGTRGISPRGR